MNEMEALCRRYGAHPDATAYLAKAFERLQANKAAYEVFLRQVQVYKNDYLFDHKPVMEALRGLEEPTGIGWATIHFLYTLYLLPDLEELYKKENIEEERFWDFVGNLRGSLGPGKEVYGLRTAWWFMDFFKLKLFTVGRLQYRRRRFRQDTVCGEQVFPENSYYLDVHIPGGGSLKPALCLESYKRAAAFYKKRFGDENIVIGCYSWLLSPDLDALLPESSNILAFAHQYTLTETVPDEGFDFLGYAFGIHGKPEDLNTLPEDSSLQRALKAWLLEGNILRLGKGYFRYDELTEER